MINKNIKVFIIYIVSFSLKIKIIIYLAQGTYIISLSQKNIEKYFYQIFGLCKYIFEKVGYRTSQVFRY